MGVLDPQELQLQMTVDNNMDTGNKTLTSARASIALNRLSLSVNLTLMVRFSF